MATLSSDPVDTLNDVEAATVTVLKADNFLGNGATTLSADIAIDATTIPLTSLTNFSGKGVVKTGDERIKYTGTSGNNLTGATRGYRGTTAAAHYSGDTVTNYNIATIHQKLRGLDAERAYHDYELPAIAVFAYGMEVAIGDTLGQWDLPIGLYMEIVDRVGDLTQTGDVQRLLADLHYVMRYQNDAASGNLDGIGDAIGTLGAEMYFEESQQGGYIVKGIGRYTVTVITVE